VSPKLKWTLAILSVCGLLAAAGFLMFHASELSPGYVKLHAYLDDASGLMDGTQVRLDGIPIGYLDGQKLTGSRNPRKKVEFDLKVEEHFLQDIPVDSTVGLASDNLLGEQYIGIHRGHSPQHVQAGAELGSSLAEDITKIMAQMSLQLDRLQAIFTRAEKLMSGVGTGKGAIGKIVQNPQAGAGFKGELDQLIADVQHGHGTMTKLLYDEPLDAQLQAPLKKLNEVMATADASSAKMKEFQDGLDGAAREFQALQNELKSGKGSAAKVGQLQTRLNELSVKIDGMMAKINSGQGTIGQLLVNPQLNEALAGTTREFQELAKGLKSNPKKFVKFKVF
jgi:phospholipid/cholesterol/gamma-HCH transport system substrate-binding protein